MTEVGLYRYWEVDMMPNASGCERVPTKITVSSTLSLRQCWVGLGETMFGLSTNCVWL